MIKIIKIIAYCLFLALLAELGIGYGGYWITQNELFDYDTLKAERREIIAQNEIKERVAVNIDKKEAVKKTKKRKRRTEIIHPYLGYVVDFHDDECPSIGFCDDRMRGYQDLLQGSDFPEASPERAFVVVTGGSVAYGIANNSTEGKLEQALSTIPELKDKEIIIYTFALGGYKQPQQLFAIQYYLAMGVHFDMIINVDGFNEIVLPLVENIPFHTNPFFPRIWHDRVTRGVENRKKKLLHGMQAYLNEQRSIIAVQMNKAFLRKSALRNLIWKIRDSSLKSRVAQAEVEYLDDVKNNPRIESKLITLGTKFERGYDEPMFERIADFWGRSSELLYDVAKGENIKYYHFLQPNQYVDGSKPMSPEERGIAFLEGSPLVHPYAAPAKQGYPYLIARGEELDKAGVPFHDLTMMFQENEELLYRDACCHYNTKGYDYIIDEIVSVIKTENSNE